MDGSIRLSAADRKTALREFRAAADPALRLRLHILLRLDDGHAWATIAAVLFTSTHTINRWPRRFHAGGLAAVVGGQRPGRPRWGAFWVALVVRWVTLRGPTEFGLVRSRWSCATVALLLRERWDVSVSRETVRRWLRGEGLVWRRPRPVLGPQDPGRAAKLRKLRALLRSLPPPEVAVFQDEVDIDTNPKIGSMWMRKGQQAEVVTPGNNVKRYLAGSLNWRTGELILTESEPGQGRNATLFVAHLDELRTRLRRYRVIHVICDNARAHDCQEVREYLGRWGHRVKVHYLPKYAPETNPIERVWWHLHEEITRNHRCGNIEELLELVFAWLEAGSCFEIETSIYPTPATIHATAA
jgi:putative transposase